MRRPGLLVALLLAVLLTAQPLLHNHSLNEKVATACSVCAFGADRTVAAPVIAAPIFHAHAFATVDGSPVVAAVPRTSSPRAPPLAA